MKFTTYDGQDISSTERYLKKDIAYIKSRWDKRAYRWDSDLSNNDCHLNRKDSYKRFIQILKSILDGEVFSQESILWDLGCGTGEILKYCNSYFDKLVGVDISSKMLDEARKKLPISVSLHEEDLFDFLKRDGKASAIVSRGIIMSHYGKLLSNELISLLYASLFPNGFIFLDALNAESGEAVPRKKSFFKTEILDMLSRHNFKDIKIYGEQNYPIVYIFAKK